MKAKTVLALIVSSIVIVAFAAYAVWFVDQPRWTFEVTTDKLAYTIGQEVTITVNLTNHGYISQFFESSLDDPAVLRICYVYPQNPWATNQVWYTPYHENHTRFAICAGESLIRKFVWNQTDIHSESSNATCKAGTYEIECFIPDVVEPIDMILSPEHQLFRDRVYFNITTSS